VLLGAEQERPYERPPLSKDYPGYAPQWQEVVRRGEPAAREFIAFWLRDGRVLAAMNVNVWGVQRSSRRLSARASRSIASASPIPTPRSPTFCRPVCAGHSSA